MTCFSLRFRAFFKQHFNNSIKLLLYHLKSGRTQENKKKLLFDIIEKVSKT